MISLFVVAIRKLWNNDVDRNGDAVSVATMKNRGRSTVASGRGIHGDDSHLRLEEHLASLAKSVDHAALVSLHAYADEHSEAAR